MVTWTTECYGLAVSALRAEGRTVAEQVLAPISPLRSENVNFFGVIDVGVKGATTPTETRPLHPVDDGCGPPWVLSDHVE